MRPGQNRRMRGRNNNNNNNSGNRKSPNPLQRSYESNGPDVKVRGTAQHVAEKYLQLARDAQSSGDPVAAENYFQHAEHYYRILLAAQEQMAQQFGHSFPPNRAFSDDPDEGEEEGEEEAGAFQPGGQQAERQSFNGNAVNGHGGQRQDGEGGEGQPGGQRFERPNRNERNFDRNQERNQDRNGQRRFDRNDRQERGERRFDRQDGQPAPYTPRPEAQPGAEQPDFAPAPAPSQSERRPERQPRGERQRRSEVPAVAPEQEVAAALPAFLTTPTRVPIAIASDEPEIAAPAPAPAPIVEAAAVDTTDAAEGEKPKRAPRRRRSPREVMDALGSDSDTAAE